MTLISLIRTCSEIDQFFRIILLGFVKSFVISIGKHCRGARRFHSFFAASFLSIPYRGICFKRHTLRLIKCDSPWRMNRIGTDYKIVPENFWSQYIPFQNLLSSHGTTCDHLDLFDPQIDTEKIHRPHHISYRDQWKTDPVWMSCNGIDRPWVCAPITRSQYVGTYDKMIFRIKYFSFSYQPRTPLLRLTICGQGMTYPDHIGSIRIELAQSSVGQGECR